MEGPGAGGNLHPGAMEEVLLLPLTRSGRGPNQIPARPVNLVPL